MPARPLARGAEEIRELLEGTWLREYAEHRVNVRRLLTMRADGAFLEHVHAVDAAGKVRQHAHEGPWLYDGTNPKRKYLRVDGKPPQQAPPGLRSACARPWPSAR